MSDPSDGTTQAALIIPHPDQARVLLLRDDGGWQLPTMVCPKLFWLGDMEHAGLLMQETFALAGVVLRVAWAQLDEPLKLLEAVYELEAPGADWAAPANAIWADQAELERTPLAHSSHQAAVIGHLSERAGAAVPELRPAWARRGWFGRAGGWIAEQMGERGTPLTGPVEQVKTWGISVVLRAPTSAGMVYLKASSHRALFGNEARIVATLAARYPQIIPTPLASQLDEGWTLLADFGPTLRESSNVPDAVWRDTVSVYGAMQRDAERNLDLLFEAGCLDRRLERLIGQLDEVLDDAPALHLLTPEERQRVIEERPRFEAACRQLDAIAIPPTLVHGDCHSGNTALRNGHPAFFDWTDACVSHPFMDIVLLISDRRLSPELRADLRSAYLELWADCASPEQLQLAWALSEVVGSLHQVVSYYHITRSLEPSSRADLEDGVPDFFRYALKALDQPGVRD